MTRSRWAVGSDEGRRGGPAGLRRAARRVVFVMWLAGVSVLGAGEPGWSARLRLAFASNREHYWYPRIVLYDHDGVRHGRIAKVLSSADKRLDHQPCLTADGNRLVCGWESEGGLGQLQLRDIEKDTVLPVGAINTSPRALFSPALSADGRFLAFCAWGFPGASARWDVQLLDLSTQQLVPLPGLNRPDADERRVTISGDGRWLAFTSNSRDGIGLTDIRLYDRESGRVDHLADMNSSATENYPSLNGDGSLLALISDRDGGTGGSDVYLRDLRQGKFLALPALNSPGQEQSVSLSSSGRYLAFVSERFHAGGEHDVFLYDRVAERLLETPGLNTARDEMDPSLVELPAR